MNATPPTPDLPTRLLAAWPAEQWRDIHLLVAASGGPDSMALLRGLLAAKQQVGGAGQLFAGHINHQLRGEASEADARWLAEQCAALNIPLHVERSDAAALAAERGDGVEAAARAARYRLLTTMAQQVGARFVAIGHTADDQVETVLFRLLRGSGLRGLAGIPATRPLAPNIALVRPLLACRRADVLHYLDQIEQPSRNDATNAAVEFSRNRIRQDLLPYLREHFNSEVDAALLRVATIAGDAQTLIESLADDLLARCRRGANVAASPTAGSTITLATGPLREQPLLLVSEALRRAWREAGWPEQAMTYAWWQDLAQFAQAAATPDSLNLPGGVQATRPAADLLALARPRLS